MDRDLFNLTVAASGGIDEDERLVRSRNIKIFLVVVTLFALLVGLICKIG